MADTYDFKTAIAIGRRNAAVVLERRAAARTTRARALAIHPAKLALGATSAAAPTALAARETTGFLVAMGDSWFDYPFYDVLKLLEDNYGYDVESSAHRGDAIEAMAYNGGQLDKLSRCFEKVTERGATPKAVLISGGGDDIAGSEFGMLLNSAASGAISGWNNNVVDGVINQRILQAYATAVEGINQLSVKYTGKLLPILVHGYDYPVPDGRGVLGGWGPLPGPWLKPGFQEKLFDDLRGTTNMMHYIMDRFNDMLKAFPAQANFNNIHIVDLRGTLSVDLTHNAYQDWWGNELHPSEKGFGVVTDKFAQALAALP